MAQNTSRNQSVWALLGDIVSSVISVIKGHRVTLRTGLRKKSTDQYPHRGRPEQDWLPRPGYRGDFALIGDSERPGGLRCIACNACANACPTGCIHIQAEGKGKDRHPAEFMIDVGLCMYCWMCVEVCPAAALTMTSDYHNVSTTPEGLIRDLVDLQQRGQGLTEPQTPVPPERTAMLSAKTKKTEEQTPPVG